MKLRHERLDATDISFTDVKMVDLIAIAVYERVPCAFVVVVAGTFVAGADTRDCVDKIEVTAALLHCHEPGKANPLACEVAAGFAVGIF